MNIVIDQEFKSLIPPLSTEERRHLEENLLRDGCRDPLVVWNGTLIDGHNRHEICTRHGIIFEVEEMHFDSREDAMDWMDKNQLGRRNLTPDIFKVILGRIYNRTKKTKAEAGEKGGASKGQNDTCLESTAEKLAKEHGVSAATVKRAGKFAEAVEQVQQEAAEERREQPQAVKVKTSEQVRVEQEAIMEEAKRRVREEEAQRKQAKKEQRMAEIQTQRDKIEAGVVEKPNGLYDVVCMDPPWNYGREYDPDTSRVANPYPEMTQGQLLEMEPPFEKDCVLFLWTTHAFIWDAKELLTAWGFTYKATVVWDKERIGMGAWVRMQCEFCLVAIKGKPFWENTTWRDIIREPRREHSRKPEVFYKMVESVTAGRRLDFFSREQRTGWEAYGNDKSKF